MNIADRYVERGVAFIMDVQKFMRVAVDFEGDEPLIPADPVVDVNDRIILAELG